LVLEESEVKRRQVPYIALAPFDAYFEMRQYFAKSQNPVHCDLLPVSILQDNVVPMQFCINGHSSDCSCIAAFGRRGPLSTAAGLVLQDYVKRSSSLLFLHNLAPSRISMTSEVIMAERMEMEQHLQR
jgi:hypothetical protein